MGLETATVLDLDDKISVSDDMESLADNWDQELTDLVAANADVIIICPWANDTEMPLGPAMLNIQVDITRENVDMVIAEVHQMLANPVVTKLEEIKEEIKAEPTKADVAKPKNVTTKVQEKPVLTAQAKEVAAVVVVQVETFDNKLDDMPVAVSTATELIRKPQKQAEVIIARPKQIIEAVDERETYELNLEITDLVESEDAEIEPSPSTDVYKTITESVITIKDELETAELVIDEVDLDLNLVPEIENILVQDKTSAEPVKFEDVDAVSEDAIAEVEDNLTLLVEQIDACEPETLANVYEIIDKIIEMPATLELNDKDEVEVQKELEELFIELFEVLEINYTPELIETLARATLKWHLTTELENLKTEEEDDIQVTTMQDTIFKQLAGLRDLKLALARAYAIGKSTLQLYKLNFSN